MVEPHAEKYAPTGTFMIPNKSDRPSWSHPVITGGRLYLRDQGVIYCYDVREKSAVAVVGDRLSR